VGAGCEKAHFKGIVIYNVVYVVCAYPTVAEEGVAFCRGSVACDLFSLGFDIFEVGNEFFLDKRYFSSKVLIKFDCVYTKRFLFFKEF